MYILRRGVSLTRSVMKDTVFIEQLAATAIVGKDAWNRPTPQPLAVSVRLNTDFSQASASDNLEHLLNYAVILRNIQEFFIHNTRRNFGSLAGVGSAVLKVLFAKNEPYTAEITVLQLKLEIRAQRVLWTSTFNNNGKTDADILEINGLRLLTVIGVFTFERLQRQVVDLDLKLIATPEVSVRKVIDDVVDYVEQTNFKTVEALVSRVGQIIFQNHGQHISAASVTVTKPNAINYTEGVGVASNMTAADFKDLEPLQLQTEQSSSSFNLPVAPSATPSNDGKLHTVYIAFGLNMGNQMAQIRQALDLLDQHGVQVKVTSLMYLSKPMYFKDQPNFYNGVVKAVTRQLPHELLATLKLIEYDHIDRKKDFDNGPRSIDLDIILYDDACINTDDLVVPHKLMLERTFVLEPLCELIPPSFVHPVTAEPIHDHLHQLLNSQTDEELQELTRLQQLLPMPRLDGEHNPLKFDQIHNLHPTMIMGILNTTPDSFSDGGKNYNRDMSEVEANALELVDEGATIIDIGGVLTRPGSVEPSEEEELERVVPYVKMIRNSTHPRLANVVISIDTYRARVAAAALEAGADIINDVSMGLYEPEIFDVVAKYNCPYVMNHTRGTPATMSKLINYEPNTDDSITEIYVDPSQAVVASLPPSAETLINGVSRELAQQITRAFARGVRKWQIILDPGIGFAKNKDQNLTLLRHASYFKRYSKEFDGDKYLSFNGMALLIGTSRKRFLGTLIDEPVAAQRVIATTATTVGCIEQNVDILRVHDVKENKEAAVVGDAIYRGLVN